MINPFDSIETRLSNIENLLLDIKNNPQPSTFAETSERRILYSIRDLSEFLGCSTVTAQKYKNEGRIPYKQIGRKVMFDTVEVLSAMGQPQKKCRK